MKPVAPLFVPANPEPEEFAEWIASRREIIARDGYALRAGAGARGHTIEIKSLTPHEQLAAEDPLRTNVWCVLALPDGAREFAQRSERDAVLGRLQERSA